MASIAKNTDVGMVVCRHVGLYKDYTSNPIPTSFAYQPSFSRLYFKMSIVP